MRTIILVVALLAACGGGTGGNGDPVDAQPLTCNGGGYLPRPDIDSCVVVDITIPPAVIRGTFPTPVEPVSDGFVRITEVFQDFDRPAVGTWYTTLDGGCAFTNCIPMRPSCASVGCNDESELVDPGCAVTGAQCFCDPDGAGPDPSLACDV